MKTTELQVIFDPEKPDQLPIKLTGEKRKRHKAASKEAMAFARYGAQVLHVKAQALAAIGKVMDHAGIKQIGHGRILVASENAEQAIATLGGLAQELVKAKPAPDYAVILEILRLVREFNHQLIVTAQVHLAADKQSTMEPTGRQSTLPPPGATVMIAIGKQNGAGKEDPA